MRPKAFRGALALFIFCAAGCAQPRTTSQKASPSAPPPTNRRTKEARQSASVDLQAMQQEPPPYEGRGRNLFDYGRAPSTKGPEMPPPSVADVLPPATTTIGPPPPPRINLKFAGLVTKPQGEKKIKYAILLDGQNIYTGTEGEVVANRYRIVEIGLESVTVTLTNSSASQRLPLKSN